MKKSSVLRSMLAVAATSAIVAVAAGAEARHADGRVDIRVWIEGGDVFPGYDDVVVWVRADRDCYSTLFLVDTAGYIHVLYPNDPLQDAWLAGGRAYCHRAGDLGLDRLDGRGIAYLFAVGSPVPFDYSPYGEGVFVGGFGFRVAGDPFVACRRFYVSLLPVACRWDYVGVCFTRFYVREWVRYPSYLCFGGSGFHVRIGEACRVCAPAYASYRCSVATPYEVIRPVPRYKETYSDGGGIRRTSEFSSPRMRRAAQSRSPEAIDRGASSGEKGSWRGERTRVVSTGKTSPGIARDARGPAGRTAGLGEFARAGFAKQGRVRGASPTEETRQKGAGKRARAAE
jgi:hypothetical protein